MSTNKVKYFLRENVPLQLLRASFASKKSACPALPLDPTIVKLVAEDLPSVGVPTIAPAAPFSLYFLQRNRKLQPLPHLRIRIPLLYRWRMPDVWHGAFTHNFVRFRFNALHNFYCPDLQQRCSMRVVSALTKTYLCETSFRVKANRITEQSKSGIHQVLVRAQEIAQMKCQVETWVKWREWVLRFSITLAKRVYSDKLFYQDQPLYVQRLRCAISCAVNNISWINRSCGVFRLCSLIC